MLATAASMRSSRAQPIRASARPTFEVRHCDRAVRPRVRSAPRAVRQLPRERVLGGLLHPRVVPARPQLAQQMHLPQRALVLLVVLPRRRPRAVVELRVQNRRHRRVLVAPLPQRRGRRIVRLAEKPAPRQHRDGGVLGLEEPADRLGGDLGHDARCCGRHRDHLPTRICTWPPGAILVPAAGICSMTRPACAAVPVVSTLTGTSFTFCRLLTASA